ncbi:flavodoxin domain-containing protein [Lacrimispora brassicae]
MNTSVFYATATGNSRKIAEAIGSKLKVKSHNIMESPSQYTTDTLVIVGGIYFGKNKKELKNFVNSLNPVTVKRAVVVTTSGAGQSRTIPAEIVDLLESKNITVLGELGVRGKALIFPTGHPSEADLKAAAEWVVNTIKG